MFVLLSLSLSLSLSPSLVAPSSLSTWSHLMVVGALVEWGRWDKGKECRENRSQTDVRQHTCEEGSLLTPFLLRYSKQVLGYLSPLLNSFFGQEINCSSVISVFCFRSSCPLGSLGGGAGTTAHCAAGPATSHFLVLLGQSFESSFACLWVFDEYTIKLG